MEALRKFTSCLVEKDRHDNNATYPLALSEDQVCTLLRDLRGLGLSYFDRDSLAQSLTLLQAIRTPERNSVVALVSCYGWVSFYEKVSAEPSP
jgi:hypothetical protein